MYCEYGRLATYSRARPRPHTIALAMAGRYQHISIPHIRRYGGYLTRKTHNLLASWLRSPACRQPSGRAGTGGQEQDPLRLRTCRVQLCTGCASARTQIMAKQACMPWQPQAATGCMRLTGELYNDSTSVWVLRYIGTRSICLQ